MDKKEKALRALNLFRQTVDEDLLPCFEYIKRNALDDILENPTMATMISNHPILFVRNDHARLLAQMCQFLLRDREIRKS